MSASFLSFTLSAILQIFILGFIGYIVIKTGVISDEGLEMLSSLVINIILPLFIFTHLLEDFKFNLFPDWWAYPVIALLISLAGFILGFIIAKVNKNIPAKREFVSLVAFQNSGYLPLVLVGMILTGKEKETMLVLISLSLIGFNLIMWSIGIFMLIHKKFSRFEWKHFFSPPVIASILALIFIIIGIDRLMPEFIFKPLKMLGDSTLALAMLVVGGNLAQMRFKKIELFSLSYLVLAKLILLPLAALAIIITFDMPYLMKLLILVQAAMPSATSLSVITTHYKFKDQLISEGIFYTHLVSLVTIPLFLSIFFNQIMLK
jgi:malate permease and related proteins